MLLDSKCIRLPLVDSLPECFSWTSRWNLWLFKRIAGRSIDAFRQRLVLRLQSSNFDFNKDLLVESVRILLQKSIVHNDVSVMSLILGLKDNTNHFVDDRPHEGSWTL